MRVWRNSIVFLFVASWHFTAFAVDTGAEPANLGRPEQFVATALQAEADGKPEQRKALLDQAIADFPEYAPARWQSGFVREGASWLSIDEASTANVRAGKMNDYRHRRNHAEATAGSQLKLARWCDATGLKDQARVHFTYALYLAPTDKQCREIIGKLGLVRYQGMLMPGDLVGKLQRQQIEAPLKSRDWALQLTEIKREIASGNPTRRDAALNRLRIIRDSSAAPALEKAVGEAHSTATREFAARAIEVLTAMPGQAAADSLTRLAVFSDDAAVRRNATEGLKGRTPFAYVPTLISAMQSPVEVQFQTYLGGNQIYHQLWLFQSTPWANYLYQSTGGSAMETDITTHRISHAATEVRVSELPDTTINRDLMMAQRAWAENDRRTTLNQRIGDVLGLATGKAIDTDPQAWTDWWNDYNEMYQSYEKPTYTFVTDATQFPTLRVQNISCFVAGTPVWTSTGSMAIEQIVGGESVLAQDPDTGELAYKPVVATTVRPRSATIEIVAARTQIRATRGHPFWVDGIGWQMAKELKVGQLLHTPRGAIKIDSVGPKGFDECYNLVVADFNSYFVGRDQVLVHDNNLRQVTAATVPGLAAP